MFLGLDLGTTNVKALITDSAGRTLAHATEPVTLFSVEDGGVEQDIGEIWNATLTVIGRVARQVEGAGVAAVGVSSQGGALQLLDSSGAPRGRVISWLDARGQSEAQRLTAELGAEWFIQRIRQRRAWLTLGQLARMKDRTASDRISFVGDLIVERLCGRAAHDGTSAGLTLLYNPTLRQYDPDLLERLGINHSRLPELISPRSHAGALLQQVAKQTGLRAGIPVSAAVHDQYAAALAAGVLVPGQVMVGTGTVWILLSISERLPEPASDTALIGHHLVEGAYGQITSLVNGGSAISWVLHLLGLGDHKPLELEGLIASSPPGSDGLFCRPLLASGGAAGIPSGRHGSFSGIQLAHGSAHFVRAVLEGLGYELARHLDMLRDNGLSCRELVLSGAAASGVRTPQMLSDITGLPVRCSTSSADSALGAAMLARGLIEPERSLSELSQGMAQPGRQIEPGADRAFYAQAFGEYMRELAGED